MAGPFALERAALRGPPRFTHPLFMQTLSMPSPRHGAWTQTVSTPKPRMPVQSSSESQATDWLGLTKTDEQVVSSSTEVTQ